MQAVAQSSATKDVVSAVCLSDALQIQEKVGRTQSNLPLKAGLVATLDQVSSSQIFILVP